MKKSKHKEVYNFVFGEVLGKEKVFLIQNIFPVTERYIIEKYQNKGQDVDININLKRKIIKQAKKVIGITEKSGINITFNDIVKMKEKLLENEVGVFNE